MKKKKTEKNESFAALEKRQSMIFVIFKMKKHLARYLKIRQSVAFFLCVYWCVKLLV